MSFLQQAELIKQQLPDQEFQAYNFFKDNFYYQTWENFKTKEDYFVAKAKHKIHPGRIPQQMLFFYNLTTQNFIGAGWIRESGWDGIKIGNGQVLDYYRRSIFYSESTASCCGGNKKSGLSDQQIFENQIRGYGYNPETLEKESYYLKLVDKQWVKTNIKTNEIEQISYESNYKDLPQSFKDEIVDTDLKMLCERDIIIIKNYADKKYGKIIEFDIKEI